LKGTTQIEHLKIIENKENSNYDTPGIEIWMYVVPSNKHQSTRKSKQTNSIRIGW
jgi:hypothetical protein